jgi:glutamine phosphoribosylpyrophosphate amidotransferase
MKLIKDKFCVIRDLFEIIPVYFGRAPNGDVYVASEIMAFHDFLQLYEILLQGKILL